VGRYQGTTYYTGQTTCENVEAYGGTTSAPHFWVRNYEGTLVASSSSGNDGTSEAERTITVRGQMRNFRLKPARAGNGGQEGSLTAEQHGFTMQIDAGNVHFVTDDQFKILQASRSGAPNQDHADFNGYDIQAFRIVEDDGYSSQSIQLNINVPSNTEVGTYTCNSGEPSLELKSLGGEAGIYRSYDGTLSNKTLRAGASCTVTIDAIEGNSLTGSYSATVVGPPSSDMALPDGNNKISISGDFRFSQ